MKLADEGRDALSPDTSNPAALAPDGIDVEALASYLPRYLPEIDGPLTAELIGGGKSNLTYYLRSPRGEWVLRRPPLGHVLPTAHDMTREFRVISALASSAVPVPTALHLCEDAAVIGAPFYVMERVRGEIIHEQLPPGLASTPDDRRRMSDAFIDALVELHAVDYQTVGLETFGRPQGFLERQVRRWGEQWDRSKTRELPAIEELRRRLPRALPESPPPTIVHGDYRLENMIFASGTPDRIVAILDWEMATLGDPLVDLAYALMCWGELGDTEPRTIALAQSMVTAAEGFPTRAELAAAYERRSGRSVDRLDFYSVFALYKLAIIVEGIQARFLAGETRGDQFEDMDARIVAMAKLAIATADSSADAHLNGRA